MKKFILFIVIAVFILISGSYFYLGMKERAAKGWFIGEEQVLGSAIEANERVYTLNFKQQGHVLKELNHSKKISNPSYTAYTGTIDSLLIYLFDQKMPLKLTPVSDDFSLFTVSMWKEPYYLKIDNPNDLKSILEQAYGK